MTPLEYRRYLRLLGIGTLPKGPEGLDAIVHSHLCRVPFENISKLLLLGREGAGRATTLSEFLDGIEFHDLGGTCYTSNPFLAGLLAVLGYDPDLLGADMSNPNVHTAIRVRIGSAEYHVDVGFGAPFRHAIPLDRLPVEIRQGRYRFGFAGGPRPESYEATVYSGEQRLYGYVVHPPPRSPDFFHDIVLDSYQPGTTFTSMLRIIRFFDDYAVDLHNRTLSIHRGGQTVETTLNNMRELRAALASDLAMPRCPIDEAVAALERLTGKPLFENAGAAAG